MGIMSLNEALQLAASRSLDLVEISPNIDIPVCKIIDYGKFNYERQKKEKLQKKHQTVMTVKEIRFNANTDTHDVEFKTRHLRQFLLDGHKVKACVIYRGRMITHIEIGEKLMNDVLESLQDIGKLESPPKLEGKMLVAYIIPDKKKIAAIKAKQAKSTSDTVSTENKQERTIDPNAQNEI